MRHNHDQCYVSVIYFSSLQGVACTAILGFVSGYMLQIASTEKILYGFNMTIQLHKRVF